MALQGTLDTFALADLVRLVATTTKTGELAIEADGESGSGRLWFVDGDLVGGEPAGPGGVEDALFALLRLEGGTFSFAPDAGPDPLDDTTAQDALEVLAAAEARLDAWRPVEALVPHPDVALRLREELSGDEVTLGRDAWRQLVAVAGGTTVRAFAVALDLDEVAAAIAVKDLADRGLVEVDADGAADPAVAPVLDDLFALGAEPADQVGADLVAVTDDVVPVDSALVDPTEPEAPASTGWGAGWDVTPVAGDPFAPVLPAEDGGSLEVDLDSYLGGAATDHRYLGGEASTLPEALPETAFASQPVPEPEAPVDDTVVDDVAPVASDGAGEGEPEDEADIEALAAEASTAPPAEPAVAGEDDDLALQLEALSPAAARAVAAAAAASEEDSDDSDAGRRVLRRIISSGRG